MGDTCHSGGASLDGINDCAFALVHDCWVWVIMFKSVDEMLRPGGVLDSATKHIDRVEQPACYVIECKKFADVLDSVRAIKNCPVTYDPDPMIMANATIERMRRYLDICTRELEALVEAKGE